MIIKKINTSLLYNNNPITVGIIDSGFDYIPSYATLLGKMQSLDHQHGNRVLSIFTALD